MAPPSDGNPDRQDRRRHRVRRPEPRDEAAYARDRIVEFGPEVLHLEASVPPMRVIMVGRKVEPTRRMLTTVLHFERPVLARLAWAIIGIGHRRTAPQVLTGNVSPD